MIIMFIGPSSSGKDYFYKKVIEKYNLNEIILSTTRPIRTGETNGVEYHFITKEEMEKLDRKKKLVERRDYNTVHGTWSYATNIEDIDLSKNYIVINTWEGYKKYKEYFKETKIYPFYFLVDEEKRLNRALERERKQENPKFEELKRRFIADKKDFSDEELENNKPIIIDNNKDIDYTMKQLDYYINNILKEDSYSIKH